MNRLVWSIGVVILAATGFAGWQMTRPAPEVTNTPAEASEPAQAATGDPLVELSLPADLSANAQLGQRMFETACVECHGQNAAGRSGIAPPLVHIYYEPSHHGDEAFQRAVQYGVNAHHWSFGNMPPVEGLTRGDVQFIVEYIRSLQRENGID